MSAQAGAPPRRFGRLRQNAYLLWLALVVVGIIALGAFPAPRGFERPYALDSTQPDGLRAFVLWLEEMGYRVEETARQEFVLSDRADLLLVFPGIQNYSREDVAKVQRWVNAGGTVLLVENLAWHVNLDPESEYLGATLAAPFDEVQQVQPLMPGAPATWEVPETSVRLDLNPNPNLVTVVENEQGLPTATLERMGKGWVWRVAETHALTNAALDQPQGAAMAVALLRSVREDAVVLFDAYHFDGALAGDASPARIGTLQDALYGTALGRALLYVLVVSALFWLVQGQRLGPPLRAREELRRREAAEYVRALASLKRRARVSAEVAAHHRQRFKLALARTHALRSTADTRQDDAAFLQRLRAEGTWDEATPAEAESILAALRAATSQEALVKAVADADAFLSEHR